MNSALDGYYGVVNSIRLKGWGQQALTLVTDYNSHTVKALNGVAGLCFAYKCYQKPYEVLAMAAFGATWTLLNHAIPQFAKDVLANHGRIFRPRIQLFLGEVARSYNVLSFVGALKAGQRVCPSFDKVAVLAAFVLTEFFLVPAAKQAIADHFLMHRQPQFFPNFSIDDFESPPFASLTSTATMSAMSSEDLSLTRVDINQIDIDYLNREFSLNKYHEAFPIGTRLIFANKDTYASGNTPGLTPKWIQVAEKQTQYVQCNSSNSNNSSVNGPPGSHHKLGQFAHLLPLETVVVLPAGRGAFQLKSWDEGLAVWVRVQRSH